MAGEGYSGPRMNPSEPVAADQDLKPLLVACFPEGGRFSPPEFPDGIPGLRPWEIALSHSSAERGWLRPLTTRWQVHCGHEADQLLARLSLFDLLIVAPLSLNSLAKFALGLRDSFPSRLFGAMVELGRPILLESTAVPRDDTLINPHFARIYRRYWDSVRGGTVEGFARDDLPAAVARLARSRRALHGRAPATGRSVLTRDDVLAAFQALQPLVVPRGALLTDLAREEAQARGVAIRFE